MNKKSSVYNENKSSRRESSDKTHIWLMFRENAEKNTLTLMFRVVPLVVVRAHRVEQLHGGPGNEREALRVEGPRGPVDADAQVTVRVDLEHPPHLAQRVAHRLGPLAVSALEVHRQRPVVHDPDNVADAELVRRAAEGERVERPLVPAAKLDPNVAAVSYSVDHADLANALRHLGVPAAVTVGQRLEFVHVRRDGDLVT